MTLNLGAAIAHVVSIRTDLARRTGCKEWEAKGVRAALLATQGPPAEVSAAACLAAGDPSLNLPSERGFVTHWPKNATTGPSRSNNVPCVDHPGQDMPCPQCKARDEADAITPEALARIKAAVLPEIAAGVARLRPRLSVPTRVPNPGDAPRLDTRRAQADQEKSR